MAGCEIFWLLLPVGQAWKSCVYLQYTSRNTTWWHLLVDYSCWGKCQHFSNPPPVCDAEKNVKNKCSCSPSWENPDYLMIQLGYFFFPKMFQNLSKSSLQRHRKCCPVFFFTGWVPHMVTTDKGTWHDEQNQCSASFKLNLFYLFLLFLTAWSCTKVDVIMDSCLNSNQDFLRKYSGHEKRPAGGFRCMPLSSTFRRLKCILRLTLIIITELSLKHFDNWIQSYLSWPGFN